MTRVKIIKQETLPEEVVVEPVSEEVVAKKRGRKPKEKKPKEKKEPSAYAIFVKVNYDKCRDLPVKERFKYLATLWKKSKEGSE